MIFITKNILLFTLPLILLSGCFNEKKEETFKTVEYYVKNKEAREVRKIECLSMIETTETISKDCMNVEIAIKKTRAIGVTSDKSYMYE